MDGVIYAEETVGGPGGPENETEVSSPVPPLYGSGLLHSAPSLDAALRKTSRIDCAQSQHPPLRSPYSGKGLGTCCTLSCFPYTAFDFAYTGPVTVSVSQECGTHGRLSF
uniref:Uncharacterized protein n=1 Tax=Peromyscus maniculatus bairdii TaxID=230844 RepID=A0A8C8UHH0_PERMB